jgi:hypothetical protein
MYRYPTQSVDPCPYPTKLRLLPPNFTVPDFISSQQKKRASQQSKENAKPSVTAGILYDTFSSPTDLPASKSTCSSSRCSSSRHSSSCHSSFNHSPSSFTSPLPPHTSHNLHKRSISIPCPGKNINSYHAWTSYRQAITDHERNAAQ